MTTNLMEKLQKQGWFITSHGYNVASDSENITDIQKIIQRLLDLDLRKIGSGQGDISQGNIVLQIQKIRNVSAPKNNEESRGAPRLLKLSLTDGKNNFQAVEVKHISSLSVNIPPGTKILIKSGTLPMSHDMILLTPAHIASVLGGKVAHLVEKWELNKKLALHTRVRSAEEGGPPPWIPFGKKIIKVAEHDKNFKSLAEKEKTSKENAEFEAQRKDALAEAAKQGSKKVFGGGNKQLLDHSVQKIVDQGFSIEQAEYALKINRNNVDKALRSLQKTDKHNTFREPREPRNKRFDKKAEESKPSTGKISLFDFFEDKLPLQSEVTETISSSQNSHTQNTESTYEKVESKSNDNQSGRGGRSQRGGRGYQVPPRHSDENKSNKRSNTGNSVTAQYPQYNGGNSSQNKPPRFQRNQDNHNYYQQDTGPKNYQKSQSSEYRNSFVQTRADGGNSNDGNNYYKAQQDQQGKSFGTARNYNHLETDARNKHSYDPSYGRHSRAQEDGTPRAYPANTNDKNYKNQLNRYQPNDNSGGRGAIGPNSQRGENQYGNNQNTNVPPGGTWVWRVGDKCLAKYWEDNRYYSAEVTGVSDRTCIVQFKGFGNYKKVLQSDCLPITDDQQVVQDYTVEPRQSDQRFNNRQPRYDQTYNHISGMEFRRGGNGAIPGNKSGYGKKRNQQRTSQPIYQPPAQRYQTSVPVHAQSNTQDNSLL